MQLNRVNHQVSDNTAGVSEIIGAILLIMIVVAAVALIGVVLFSQQTPGEIPNINFMTGTDNSGNLYLYHNGGDALKKGEFAVRVDGVIKPYTISDNSDTWSLGTNLKVLGVPSGTHSVAIIYNGTSGAESSVLRSSSSSSSVFYGTINPDTLPSSVGSSGGCAGYINGSNPQDVVDFILDNPSLIGDAMNQSPSTVGPVIADVIITNSTNYFRKSGTDLDQYTRIQLEITGSESTFSYGTTSVKNLEVGDIIVITQAMSNPDSWKIFGLGDQIWEFSADGVWVDWKKQSTGLWTNTSRAGTTSLYHTWITGYKDIGSTLTIRTNGNDDYQALVYNGVKQFEGLSISANDDVVIRNIRPVGIGLLTLEYDHNTNTVYFIGYAESVTWS